MLVHLTPIRVEESHFTNSNIVAGPLRSSTNRPKRHWRAKIEVLDERNLMKEYSSTLAILAQVLLNDN